MKANRSIRIAETIPGYTIVEIVYESAPHIIFLAKREEDGKEVVLKTLQDKYPKKENLASIQREYNIINKLQFEGIIQCNKLIEFGNGSLAIEMEHFGISIEEYLSIFEKKILPLQDFYTLAIKLVNILDQLHEHDIVHKDLVPRNILIDPESGDLRIIDFSNSSELSREHQESTLAKNIEGSLPYMAPEQTGRMNRDIDYRTDYYTLGITFFQMLTGKLPFQANDALEWVHCHISRQPSSPIDINPKLPVSLSMIVEKMMSKNAEDRYQSGYGLIADLKKSQEAYLKGSLDETFQLATLDISSHFQIPQKLYGRINELKKLVAYFEKTTQGNVEFVLVSGYSGVGKSVLVQELGRSIVKKRGYLIQGKFEQFRQNSAYIALSKAFRDLVRQLLGEPADRLEFWNKKLKKALDNNAQLIIELVPELELIIGKQPPVLELSPNETQNRFLIVFINFVKVFTAEQHPLVIFLDDLQWSDIPTLNLIQRLVTSQELNHLMIIGAFRDNAVDDAHPLTLTLEEIHKKRPVENLALQPLTKETVDQIIMDTMNISHGQSTELSELLFEKTGGNPFFTIEILKNLHDQSVIYFDQHSGIWTWDIEKVKNVEHCDNVVDFLVASQHRLPDSTQYVLQLAACIGATFDLKNLSIIREGSMEETASELYEALKSNIIIPLNENYRLVGLSNSLLKNQKNNLAESNENLVNPTYKFQHDRVQQAAYSLIETDKRKALHLSIGRLILSHLDPDEFDEKIMDIVGHLNEGRSLVTDPKEQEEIAELNLQAGIKAKQSSAYLAALEYLKISFEIVKEQAWKSNYPLMWKLSEELQNCFYLTGDWENADIWTEIMLSHAKTPIEKGLVLSARTRQYATIGKMQESIQAAYEGLSILGFDFKKVPSEKDVDEEIKLVAGHLQVREIADLINMPALSDPKARIASNLLMEIFPAAFLSGSGMTFPYLVLKSVNISLEFGNSPETAFSYAAYGMLLCGYFDDQAKGFQFGKLGVDLIEKYEDISLKSRILYVYTMFVHHWSNHWSSMTPWFRKGIETGYQSGDLLYLAYSAQDCVIWDPQLDLETASNEQRKLLKIVKECDYQDSYDSGTLFLQMQLNFQGLTKDLYSLTDDSFDESLCVQGMFDRHFMTGIANYHIYKAEIHLLYNDFQGALSHVLEQEKLMASVMSLPQLVRFHITSFLVKSSLLENLKTDHQAAFQKSMEESLGRITHWAQNCPENFLHLQYLMEAELTGLTGNLEKAIQLYEKSISSANKNNFVRDEAVANERAALFLIKNGLSKAADGYLQASHYLYYRWGAYRKTEELEKVHQIFSGANKYSSNRTVKETLGSANSDTFSMDFLDLSSVFRASQTISGELVLDKLLKATLQILIENAGAQDGFLVEQKDGQIIIKAQNGNEISSKKKNQVLDQSNFSKLPLSLINTALRTNQSIVIDNAKEENSFSSDPYFQINQPLSIMCVPLSNHSQWKVAVYLENNLTHSAFTEERVKIIKLLAGQAAISIENARIYEEQDKLLKAQQRFVPIQFLKHLGHNDIAKVKLGESVSMEMSVLFSDIREFTPLVELLSPQAVIELLNQYYSKLGQHISESGGFIDSYAGDEILALFAVPATQAVEAGIKMGQSLWKFNHESGVKGRPILKMGIGVNTGPLVLGTMGGQDRMQCTVLGDTVNLASRIEQLTKVYNSQFIIGENTYEALENPEKYTIRMIDRVAVKGKMKAVKLYEVLDAESDERRFAKESTLKLLQEGMEVYYQQDFSYAHQLFRQAFAIDPFDPVLSSFISRSKRYIENPPPKDWAGYENLNTK